MAHSRNESPSAPEPRTRPKACVSWSSGKDAAFALWESVRQGEFDVAGLMTTVNVSPSRVAVHSVREALLDLQSAALGLPCLKVELPTHCPNDIYEARMSQAAAELADKGITHIIFGDLFLDDIRTWRDERLARWGLTPVYPLWGRDTAALAREMIASGLVAHLACVDSRRLSPDFAGRRFDTAFLESLPAGVDPCGENGEFHTAVTDSPLFASPIPVRLGGVSERNGFVYADIVPDPAAGTA
ncbi:ATP-binding protein [Iodidimonas sp. SYSU 1G8]|uniref:Dph6-related ATP pyrophosphatase n=1 Tax=Iodidimonas sp. SYSU 1G8 TaxID=3133967 RepID=UPI0031FED060